jgi:hypothetical protein
MTVHVEYTTRSSTHGGKKIHVESQEINKWNPSVKGIKNFLRKIKQ